MYLAHGRLANGSGLTVSNVMDSRDLDTSVQATEAPEIALVQEAQSGDADAFAALVRTYQRRAVSVAFRLLGNIEDASDVSQDAFVRAYRHLGQLDDPARFGAWLMRTVSNLSLNYRRSRRTRLAGSLDEATVASAEARNPRTGQPLRIGLEEGDGPLPEELHGAINVALERLPDKQRLALILFSVEGLPQKEVAEILECSVELVKWNVFQARKKLREALKEFM